jgi:prevent-host-death family protein
MKIKIGSYEAKTKLPELLRQVKTGKSFTITNRGEAIAELQNAAKKAGVKKFG